MIELVEPVSVISARGKIEPNVNQPLLQELLSWGMPVISTTVGALRARGGDHARTRRISGLAVE